VVTRALTKSKRFNEIFHIMLEHRLPSVLRELALYARSVPEAAQPAQALAENGAGPTSVPARIRRMMEDLGPTFIKIGQLLGTRPDLIPKAFIEEFKKMYDQTSPTPFPEVKKVVEGELGKPLSSLFRAFDETPIASASIAQVHRAVLRNGDVVAVKVQHPGIEERMRTDFEILRGILQFTEKVFAATQVWQPVKHMEEIEHMLNKELDFRNELRIQAQVEENFRRFPEVEIPHPFPEYSTARVLVMEFVDGTKFHARERLKLTTAQSCDLARIITHAMAKQIFLDRLFHADPSPGNLLLIGKNRVCFLDFGAVGQVTKRRARLILDFITSLNSGNLDDTARTIVELCDVRKEYDPKRFLYDLERIIEYYETEHASPADPVLLEKIINLANTHGMLLPADFMLITRALYQFDGMCKELDPDYELVRVLTPFLQKTMRERSLAPELQKEAMQTAMQDLAKFATRLPGRVETLLLKLEKGQLTSRVEIQGLEEYKRHSLAVRAFNGFTLLLGLGLVGTLLAYTFRGAEGFRVAAFATTVMLLVWALVVVVVRQGLRRRR
jgi:ubiquinone biosynthesis protein